MRKILSGDTKPEIIARKYLHGKGFRYRLHREDLPGKPDIVLPKYKTALFFHGCFWHRHLCKKGQSLPTSNTEFWVKKFKDTIYRYEINHKELVSLGWNCWIIWECEINDNENLKSLVKKKLGSWLNTIIGGLSPTTHFSNLTRRNLFDT